MTRHQVWKARERARFRADSELTRFEKLYKAKAGGNVEMAWLIADPDHKSRLTSALLSERFYSHLAAQRGIPQVFTG